MSVVRSYQSGLPVSVIDMLINRVQSRWSGLLTLALQSPPGIHRIFMMAARVKYEWERERARREKIYSGVEKDR